MDASRTPTLVAASLLVALAACANTAPRTSGANNTRLADAATALERNARILATRSDGVDQDFAQHAHEFQQHAFDFREAAASGRASDSELRADFSAVTDSYDALRAEAQQLNTTQATSAVGLVSGPYQDVAAQMGAPASGM
jgi:hypothetical protein